MLLKSGLELPTIPATAFHDDSEWLDTDIYENELYVYTKTDPPELYTRKGEDIINLSDPGGGGTTHGFEVKGADQIIVGQDPVAVTQFTFPIPKGKFTEFELVGAYQSSVSQNGVQLRLQVEAGDGAPSALGSMYVSAGVRGNQTVEIGTAFGVGTGQFASLDLTASNADGGVSDFFNGKGVIDATKATTDGTFTLYAWNEQGGRTITIMAGSSLKYSSYSS